MTNENTRIIPLISDEVALEPSVEGLNILSHYFPDDFSTLMLLAQSGTHTQNPYHNLHHELSCVYWAHSCAMNSPGPLLDTSIPALVLAALFHDHNHSGGRTSDRENIGRATRFAQYRLHDVVSSSTLAKVIDTIRCTEFSNGTFPREPASLMHQCMRDADLMMIYSAEGRQLTIGLGLEMGFNFMSDHDRFIEQTSKFLTGARMYTEHGQYMQSTFLNDCLLALGDDIAQHRNEALCPQ
jgi:hypothetical protein